MRAILLILIIAVVALIAAVLSGLIDIDQTRPAMAPGVETSDGKIVARPGQSPEFEVKTGSIGVATGNASVTVPKIEIQPSNTRIGVPTVEVRRPGDAPPAAPAPAPAANSAQ
jgi:hypothetical protein